jgi:tRNA A-37 threonylcarbamoyl transferase component Bud32
MDRETDSNTISKILAGDFREMKLIEGKGQVNRVYLVEGQGRTVIVRLNESGEIKRFRKEKWCIEEVTKLGIPSPKVLDIGEDKETSYMVLSFIPGLNGKEITENKSKVWKAIGGYARKINSIKTNGFGERMTTPGSFDFTWERHLQYNIDSLSDDDKLLRLRVVDKEESGSIKRVFEALNARKFDLGLIHGDLSLANVIVNEDEIYLIDWGTARSHLVPHMELSEFTQDNLNEENQYFSSFLEGYGLSLGEYQEMKSDIEALTLLNAIDKLRWAIDKKPKKIDEFSKRLRRLIDQNITP